MLYAHQTELATGYVPQLNDIHTIFCSEWVFGFVIEYAWMCKLLCDAAFAWRSSWLKSNLFRDLFRGNWLSERFLYCKKYYFNVFEFLERWIYAYVAKLSDRCFCWSPPAMLLRIRMGANMAPPYKSQIAVTWILGRVFAELPSFFFFQILDSIYWTGLILILIFYEWRDTEHQQFLACTVKQWVPI